MFRCNIRELNKIVEGRGVKLDDGVERKDEYAMGLRVVLAKGQIHIAK